MMAFILLQINEDGGPDLFPYFIFLLFVYGAYKIYQWTRQIQQEKYEELAGPHPITTNPDCLVYSGKNLNFSMVELDTMLKKHFPYYRDLNTDLKKRFLRRLHIFIQQKIFIIRHCEGYKEMPVLLSAAAIQITFGLEHFRLPFFKYMQIHAEEYFADDSLRVLAGHVYGSTITIAWNHFYKNYQLADGVNVGLHEMAHALYFQRMEADVLKKNRFIESFKMLMDVSEEVYNGCRQTAGRLFTKNAFKDLQEFWAESLEIFFEKPAEMNNLYPELFNRLCFLLLQNPLDKDCPIIKEGSFNWTSLEKVEYLLSKVKRMQN